MKFTMKLLSETYNDEDFNQCIKELESQGWELKKQYGGTLPNFKGHGAELEKHCFALENKTTKNK